MPKLTERAKVKRKFPKAYAFQWGPREWCIYAAEDGPFMGIDLSGTRSSQKAAWLFAAMSGLVTGKNRAASTRNTRDA
jgi:hypothetical protein